MGFFRSLFKAGDRSRDERDSRTEAGRQDVPPQVVAAVSAAVHMYMEQQAPGRSWRIAGIQPQALRGQDSRAAWGAAGVLQNTEPFPQ